MSFQRFLFLLSAAGLMACNGSRSTPSESLIYGLATPVQLKFGMNEILLDDYFTESVSPDSMRLDADFTAQFNPDFRTVSIDIPDTALTMLMNLTLFVKGIPYGILLKAPTEKLVWFTYHDGKPHAEVKVKGEFNSWDANLFILKKDKGNAMVGYYPCKPGKYQYKYVVDGKEVNDPGNAETISNGMGGTNSVLHVEGPKVDIMPELATSHIEQPKIFFQALNVSKIYAYWENFRLEVLGEGASRYVVIPPFAKDKKRSFIRIYACGDQAVANDLLIPLEKDKVLMDPGKLNNSDWHSSIMYFMMVDRFMDGDPKNNRPVKDPAILPKANFMGGDLKGITQKITSGYFKDLGINTIWISPIAQNPLDAWGQFNDPDTKFSGYHGYWPISSSKVDHRFGTSDELKELLETAHKHGISVLLDYVAHHVHQQHPVYQQHMDWVTPLYLPDGSLNTERWDDHRLTTWFDTFMPTLNLMDTKVADFMVDSAAYWIRAYDFDGFRHDATKHIPENFWRSLTKEVKQVSMKKGKHIYQIGETYGSHDLIKSYVSSGMLDGQFDFNLYDHALAVFASPNESFQRVSEAVETSLRTYGHHHMMGNISGNQDKPRFISFADGSLSFDTPWQEYKRIGWKQNIGIKDTAGYHRLAMFNAFNMTIPGIPIVYYGDEIGMPGANDPDNRRMMKFDDLNRHELQLKKKVADLTRLRMSNLAMIYGDFRILKQTDDLLVYQRKYFDQDVLVMMNRNTKEVSYTDSKGKKYAVRPGGYLIVSNIGNRQTIIQ